MGTAPNGWQTPKTDWANNDAPVAADFNRIEGNSNAIETGDRTVDQTQTPTGHVGTLRQFLDWIANRIKAITGTTNWYDAPPTTLTAAKSHIDAAAPHSGHETPSGAQAKVDAHSSQSAPHSGHATTSALSTHTSATSAHSATSAATANRIMLRDAAGRAKVAAPAAADDIARKDTVDATLHATTGHKHTGATGDGPLLGVDSQVWIDVGDTVLAEDLPERYTPGTVYEYTGFFVTKPGRYRITGDFRSAVPSFEVTVCIIARRPTLGTASYYEIISGPVITTASSYTSFTLDLPELAPPFAIVGLQKFSSQVGVYVRNVRLRGIPVQGNPVPQVI